LTEPDKRCPLITPDNLDNVVHVVAVEAGGVGDEDEVALPNLKLLDRQELMSLRVAVLTLG
jgi:hypothetical protein